MLDRIGQRARQAAELQAEQAEIEHLQRLFARLLQYLDVHARHLERHLSTWFSPNTHLTGEALALLHLGVLLPELRGAARWREQGLAVLHEWFPRQVRADGTYFEQATQYHRYTTEFYFHLLLLAERSAREGYAAPVG